MAEAKAAVKKPRRKALWLVGCLTPILLLALAIGFVIHKVKTFNRADVQTVEGDMAIPDHMLFNPLLTPAFNYNGNGRLEAHVPFGCREGAVMPDVQKGISLTGRSVVCKPVVESKILGGPRSILVHLPKKYDPAGAPYPLVIAFHGFGQRPHHVARILVPQFDNARMADKLPSVVLVMPDMSISGTGLDDTTTPYDDVGGSWGVNSNLGRFADYVTQELVPWIEANYNVRRDGAGTVVLGGSMGGSIAIDMLMNDPRRFPNAGGFYPALDLRYSCDGSRVADYRIGCYKPIDSDDPDRQMITTPGLKETYTERMFLYPVFDSDAQPGPVWNEDQPVWQRLRENNVVDRLRDGQYDLHGTDIWYVVGDQDDFNIDAQVSIFDKLATEAGATVEPNTHWRAGRHDLPFIQNNLDEAIFWMNGRLAVKKPQE